MPCALYGKLLAKRDFIAEGVPRGFLDVFEPWLHGALSASRLALGAQWQRTYFSAPIWRFWLGEGHCGRALLGALMPSVDGVGRSFPLVAFAAAPEGHAFARPDEDAQEGWFDAVETFLLSTLETQDFAQVTRALAQLPEPAAIARPALPQRVRRLAGGLAALGGGPALPQDGLDASRDMPTEDPQASSLGALLRAAPEADGHLAHVHASWWWTIGGTDFPPAMLLGRTLPDAAGFAALLDGSAFKDEDAAERPSMT